MLQTIKNYIENFLKIKFQNNPILKPLFFTYYITNYCNFDCSYCNYAISGQTKKSDNQLDTNESIKLLNIIRKSCSNIYFTGGEPLLRNDIVDIVKACKQMNFKTISINTNMYLIHKKREVLDYITHLIASFDILDEEKNSEIINMPLAVTKQVKQNIIDCAKLQKEKKFKMVINCVVTEKTIHYVKEVMDFCLEHNMKFAVVPASLSDGKINFELKNNESYKDLIKEIIKMKKDNKSIFNSLNYLNTIYDFKQFRCYPTLTPHVYPNGDLLYPCQPISEANINLLETESYEKALDIGIKKYGKPPKCKNRCYFACYIEPPNIINNPLSIINFITNN